MTTTTYYYHASDALDVLRDGFADSYFGLGPVEGEGVMLSDNPPSGDHRLEVTLPGELDAFLVSQDPRLWIVPAALLNAIASVRLAPVVA